MHCRVAAAAATKVQLKLQQHEYRVCERGLDGLNARSKPRWVLFVDGNDVVVFVVV